MSSPKHRYVSREAMSRRLASRERALEDAKLVVAVCAGEAAALERLMSRLLRPVEAAVGAVLGARHSDLDDVVQEALMRVRSALPAYRGECSPASYARRIAVRVAARARRRSQRRSAWLLLEPSLDEAPSNLSAGAGIARSRLRQMLAELPEKQAQAFVLRFGLGLSLPEIARAGGAPVNTIRSRIIAARRTLRGRLQPRPFWLDLALTSARD